MKHDLDVDTIFKADLKNIVRLAEVVGVPNLEKLKTKPDAKWRISCAIIRWYKKNPK